MLIFRTRVRPLPRRNRPRGAFCFAVNQRGEEGEALNDAVKARLSESHSGWGSKQIATGMTPQTSDGSHQVTARLGVVIEGEDAGSRGVPNYVNNIPDGSSAMLLLALGLAALGVCRWKPTRD